MARKKGPSEMGYDYSWVKRPKLSPWSMQVELHEGCTRRCWFCGIRVFHKKGEDKVRAAADSSHDIDLLLLHKIFGELDDWLGSLRVEINSHGEPTLHPSWFESLQIMSSQMPTASLNLQTNCEPWIDDDPEFWIRRSFMEGLDVLVLNTYNLKYYDFFLENLPKWNIPFVDYYYDNPDNVSGNAYFKKEGDMGRVLVWKDLGLMNTSREVFKLKKNNKRLHNSGGNGDEALITKKTGTSMRELPLNARCSKVHREIILGWNGIIPISCQDWRDEFVVGDCNVQDIRDIWFSDRWEAARQLLYRKRRDLLRPCVGCDDSTTRTGLDKDPALELSDVECLDVIRETHKEQWGSLPLSSLGKWTLHEEMAAVQTKGL